MPGERAPRRAEFTKRMIKIGPSKAVPIVRSDVERANIQTRVSRKARLRTTIVSQNFSDRVIAFGTGTAILDVLFDLPGSPPFLFAS